MPSPAYNLWRIKSRLTKGKIALEDRFRAYSYTTWLRHQNMQTQPCPAPPEPGQAWISFIIGDGGAHPPQEWQATLGSLQALSGCEWEAWQIIQEPALGLAVSADPADSHLRIVPFESARNPNDAIDYLLANASGQYLAWMRPGDQVAPGLVAALAEQVTSQKDGPIPEVVYFDEDHLMPGGRVAHPFFKPDLSPELLFSINFLEHACFRCELVKVALGELPHFSGMNWERWLAELAFWVAGRPGRVVHIPRILYHQAASLPDPNQPTMDPSAILGHLLRQGLNGGQVTPQPSGSNRISWKSRFPKVSIIIPTRDHARILKRCLKSLFEHTVYPDYEVILVDNASQNAETLAFYSGLRTRAGVTILENEADFNYSAFLNRGVRAAQGEVLLFLNNDVEIIAPDWLEELVRWALRPEIGMVGACLLYPNGTVQHTGIILGLDGHAGHIFQGALPDTFGPFGSPEWYRDVLAVTGACQCLRRDVFEEVGGFDEGYTLVFSDVELGLAVTRAGYRVMVNPFSRLVHYEGRTRFRYIPPHDLVRAYGRFKEIIAGGDPFFNPNLSHLSSVPTLRRREEDMPVKRLEIIYKEALRTK